MPLLLRPKEGVLNRERSVEDEEYHRLLIQKGGAVGASAVARSSTAQIGDEEVGPGPAPLALAPTLTLTLTLALALALTLTLTSTRWTSWSTSNPNPNPNPNPQP